MCDVRCASAPEHCALFGTRALRSSMAFDEFIFYFSCVDHLSAVICSMVREERKISFARMLNESINFGPIASRFADPKSTELCTHKSDCIYLMIILLLVSSLRCFFSHSPEFNCDNLGFSLHTGIQLFVVMYSCCSIAIRFDWERSEWIGRSLSLITLINTFLFWILVKNREIEIVKWVREWESSVICDTASSSLTELLCVKYGYF